MGLGVVEPRRRARDRARRRYRGSGGRRGVAGHPADRRRGGHRLRRSRAGGRPGAGRRTPPARVAEHPARSPSLDRAPQPANHSSAACQAASAWRRCSAPCSPAAGYEPRNFTPGQTGVEVAQAVGHDLVTEVAGEVDDEAVVTQPCLVGRDSSLVRLMLRAANWPRMPWRLPGWSARWKHTMLVLSWPVGSGTRVRATEHEAGLVVRVVLDVLGEDGQAVALGGQPRGDGGLVGRAGLARAAGPRRRWSWPPAARPRAASRPGTSGTGPGRGGRTTPSGCRREPVPGRAMRWRWMSMTTSRWMCRSTSWISPSMVALTVPSMAFSMGTNPRSTSPRATASSTAVIGAERASGRPSARSGWVSSASWVKVAAGPK